MKDKKLTASSKDKKLLLILATLVASFLVYQYWINPTWEKTKELSIETAVVDNQLETARLAISELSANRELNKNTKAELMEKYKVFFYDIKQERLMYYLDDLAIKSGLKLTSYDQSTVSLEAIPQYRQAYSGLSYPILEDAAVINDELTVGTGDGSAGQDDMSAEEAADGQKLEIFPDSIPVVHIELSFTGAAYENIINFLKLVERAKRSVIIDSINILRETEGEEGAGRGLEGSISLSAYSLPKLDPFEAGDLLFSPRYPTGKTGLFQTGGGGGENAAE
ncbi:hypothetical protein MASR2M70_15800 [Bacillota bacterium]